MDSTDKLPSEAVSSAVAVLRCEDYAPERVEDCLFRGVTLLGGVQQFVRPGERMLLKPNLLSGKVPDKAVTTHPAVFQAAAKQFLYGGARLAYGDSPGFGRISTVVRRSGLHEVAESMGIELVDFQHGRIVSFPEGALCKQFTIAEGALDADGIISLSKMKTHALTRITGAVKNQFGCIPGMLKGEFHGRLSKIETFAKMLVDLTRLLSPRLYIMDGIVSMEGNGPGNGTPRKTGVLLLSTDPVALDAAFCRLVNLDPELVPTIVAGAEAGLGDYRSIRFLGDPIETCLCPDFKVKREKEITEDSVNRFLVPLMRRHIIPRPVIREERCTHCGTCVAMCPVSPKAVDFLRPDRSRPPKHNYGLCIRCYCCQEVCPDNAIEVETPWLGRLIHKD